jgi:hypothetical protein
MSDARIEARGSHLGQLFRQSNVTAIGTQFAKISVRDSKILANNQTLDLLVFGGRVAASFKNVEFASGLGIVRFHPTTTLSGSPTNGGNGGVNIENCTGVSFVKATSTPYNNGAYDRSLTVFVNQENGLPKQGGTFNSDDDGFFFLNSPSGGIFSRGYGVAPKKASVVFGNDSEVQGFGDVKAIVPANSYLMKFFAFKQPVRRPDGIVYTLYIVKDKSSWASSTFDYTTDGIEVASIDTSGLAGYFEAEVRIPSTVLGNGAVSGREAWQEGRIFMRKTGTPATMIGFVGVEFL